MTQIQKTRFDYNAIERNSARGLRSQATAIKAAISRTQNDIIEIGRRLRDVREILDNTDFAAGEHISFRSWISAEFGMTERSARNFIYVANGFESVENFSALSFDKSALYALAAPSVSDETRAVAVELAEAGETITHANAKTLIEAGKPQIAPSAAPESSTQNVTPVNEIPTSDEPVKPFYIGDRVEWRDGADQPHSGIYRGVDPDTNDAIVDECDGDEDLVLEPPVAALQLAQTGSANTLEPEVLNSESQTQTHVEIDDIETQAEVERDDIDGYGRPFVSPQSTPPNTTANTSTVATDEAPKLTIDQRIAQLPLTLALEHYGHNGHIFRQQAAIWYERQGLMRNAHAALSAVRYTTGPVTDAIRTLANIPDPVQWTGCAACKGSMRVGERSDPCQSCRGGFTTYADEGVSADVVADYAANLAA